MPVSQDLTWTLAQHAAETPIEAVPSEALTHAASDLVDSLAAVLGGVTAEGVAETRAVIGAVAPEGASRVFGTDRRWPAMFAAQANATAGHALDYDDTLDAGGGMHAGVPVHVSALAVADELGGVSGGSYLAHVSVGLDVAVRLALAPTQDFGWHRTAAFGIFGATVATGRLLGLSADTMHHALGIAYSQASGNRQCIADGALSKRLQSGFAARDAITAVQLAQAGLTGATNAFEGRDGFFNVYQRGEYRRETVLEELGTKFMSTEISLKPYPCGRNLHAAIDSALDIRNRAGKMGAIERVVIEVGPRAAAAMKRAYPEHVVQAQFSVPFAVALALATGGASIGAFADPGSCPDDVKAHFGRTEIVEWPDAPQGAVRVTVGFADGTEDSQVTEVARGHPSRPLTRDDLRVKFRDCCTSAGLTMSSAQVEQVIDRGLAFADASDTRELTALLEAEGAARA